jgi:hypothetical protein
VLCTCALHPWVNSAQFVNGPNTPDKTLYWQLRCHGDDGAEWKIDMRSAPEDYALPRGEDLMQPMKDALAPETRAAILALKEARMAGGLPMFLAVDLYRTVLEGGVRTADQWLTWQRQHATGVLTGWKPSSPIS